LPVALWSLMERFLFIRLDVQDEEQAFAWLKLWLAHRLRGTLSVSVYMQGRFSRGETDAEFQSGDRRSWVLAPAPGTYFFRYAGAPVQVTFARVVPDANSNSIALKPRESFTFRIFSHDLRLAERLIDEARRFALPSDGRIEVLTNSSDYWRQSGRVRPRPLDSVILDNELAQFVLRDVRTFQSTGDWYARLGIPYRRGYLLYGPPGGGKSSFVLALASELRQPLHVLSLSSPAISDSAVGELLDSVDPGSLVLIEDVDCAFRERVAGKDRQQHSDSLTFSGLLNALDGIGAADGRIVFMTTNHPEMLDLALTRPGRCDVKVHIGHATRRQAVRLFKRFHPHAPEAARLFGEGIPDRRLSMAAIQEHLVRYKESAQETIERLEELTRASAPQGLTASVAQQ